MANVSRPMLIVLAVTVAFFAVWLVALRPKPVAVEQTPLAPTKAVWSRDGAQDVATRRAIGSLNRRQGKVKVHVIPIGRVGSYRTVTRGITVAQSPTTLIIGDKGRVRTIVGLTEPTELGQAVTDAIAKR